MAREGWRHGRWGRGAGGDHRCRQDYSMLLHEGAEVAGEGTVR